VLERSSQACARLAEQVNRHMTLLFGAIASTRASRAVTAILWSLLGSLLVWNELWDILAWARDGYYSSFSWSRRYLPGLTAGVVVLVGACTIWFELRALRVPLLVWCWIQVAYGLAFMLFGPEGTFLYARVAPVLLIAFSLWTIFSAKHWFRGASGGATRKLTDF
jgi:hypothetical protein